MKGSQDSTTGSCMSCGAETPLGDDGDWLYLDVRISAGHRGPSRWMDQPTEVIGLVICPVCYAGPGGEHLRTMIEQRYQAPITGERGCHITCRGRVNRRRTIVSRMIGTDPLRCPICYGRSAYSLEEPPPRPGGALDKFRPRHRVK